MLAAVYCSTAIGYHRVPGKPLELSATLLWTSNTNISIILYVTGYKQLKPLELYELLVLVYLVYCCGLQYFANILGYGNRISHKPLAILVYGIRRVYEPSTRYSYYYSTTVEHLVYNAV